MMNASNDKEKGYADLGHTKTDLLREQNSGFDEVVFGKGKTTSQLIDIINHAATTTARVFVTGCLLYTSPSPRD